MKFLCKVLFLTFLAFSCQLVSARENESDGVTFANSYSENVKNLAHENESDGVSFADSDSENTKNLAHENESDGVTVANSDSENAKDLAHYRYKIHVEDEKEEAYLYTETMECILKSVAKVWKEAVTEFWTMMMYMDMENKRMEENQLGNMDLEGKRMEENQLANMDLEGKMVEESQLATDGLSKELPFKVGQLRFISHGDNLRRITLNVTDDGNFDISVWERGYDNNDYKDRRKRGSDSESGADSESDESSRSRLLRSVPRELRRRRGKRRRNWQASCHVEEECGDFCTDDDEDGGGGRRLLSLESTRIRKEFQEWMNDTLFSQFTKLCQYTEEMDKVERSHFKVIPRCVDQDCD